MSTRMYIKKDKQKWEDKIVHKYENKNECVCTYVENGYILPLKKIKVSPNNPISNSYSGGVQTGEGKFVAGHSRSDGNQLNFCCTTTYEIDKKVIKFEDEEIIYGGICFSSFGHCLAESFSRLWYVLEEKNVKIAFCYTDLIPGFFWEFLNLLGIRKERVLLVDKIYGFRKIIIPEQSWIMFSNWHANVKDIYRTMSLNSVLTEKIKDKKKIYLSRTQFTRGGINDCINESYFENFYKRKGYEVISPETLSINEQVALLANAEEVICTGGTLSHLCLFAKEGTKLTILLRCNEVDALVPQIVINGIKSLNVCIVDCSYNYLPTHHASGVFLVGPTEEFIEYLEMEKVNYSQEEIVMDFESTAYPYLCSWINNYSSNTYPYKTINKKDIFDVVSCMSEVILHKKLSREQMATPIRCNITQKEFIELKKNYEIQKNENIELEKNYKIQKNENFVYRYIFHIMKETFEELMDICLIKKDFEFELLKKKKSIEYDVHFSKRGWINENNEFVVAGEAYSGNGIEAIRANINDFDIGVEYGAYVDKEGWKFGKDGEVAGTIGVNKPVIGLWFKIDSKFTFLYDILYRVGNEENLTRWYKNGEVTETFMWNKIETLEIRIDIKENDLKMKMNQLVQNVKEYKEYIMKYDVKKEDYENKIKILKDNEKKYLQEIENLTKMNSILIKLLNR